MTDYKILFVPNSFYLAVTADTDPQWVQQFVELGAIVKTNMTVRPARNQTLHYIGIYWIDETRAKGHLKLPNRPRSPAQYSVKAKPNLN